jgi:hypothetical protein
MKITITEGLVRLKTLDSRINKAINSVVPTDVQVSGKLSTRETPEEFKKSAKAAMQSANDLIALRDKIKCAIVKANASTKVTIGSQEMTIAEAIDKKEAIAYKKLLLGHLTAKLGASKNVVDRNNLRMQEDLTDHLNAIFGTDKKVSDGMVTSITKEFKETREATIVDPLGIQVIITDLEEEISDFEDNVDTQLSIINASTQIEIEE